MKMCLKIQTIGALKLLVFMIALILAGIEYQISSAVHCVYSLENMSSILNTIIHHLLWNTNGIAYQLSTSAARYWS